MEEMIAASEQRRVLASAQNPAQHLRNIKPAVLTVGGWFDAENLYGTLNTYASIEQKNPGITQQRSSWGRGFTAGGRAPTAIASAARASDRRPSEYTGIVSSFRSSTST